MIALLESTGSLFLRDGATKESSKKASWDHSMSSSQFVMRMDAGITKSGHWHWSPTLCVCVCVCVFNSKRLCYGDLLVNKQGHCNTKINYSAAGTHRDLFLSNNSTRNFKIRV